MSLKDRFEAVASQNTNKIKQDIKLPQKIQEKQEKVSSIGVLNTLLDDAEVQSIYINGAKNVYIERKKKFLCSTITFKDNSQLENLIQKYAQLNNCKNEKYIKFAYKMGVNAQATLPPLTNVPTLFIKCYKEKFANFQALEAQKALSKEISLFIEALTKKNVNIIIAGNKKTFKTTLLNAIENIVQTVNRCVNIDFSKEIHINKNNFTNYNLNEIENLENAKEIVKSIINTTPEKTFINDCPQEILSEVIKFALNGTKGICFNINAASKEEAMEKVTLEFLKTAPFLNYDLAKALVYKAFDYMIFVDDKEERKIEFLSEILSSNQDCSFKDIFFINELNKHSSTGYIPDLFLEDENNALNLNIFNENYVHTYLENTSKDKNDKTLEINPEILKKFKKEPKEQEIELNETENEYFIEEEIEQENSLNEDEINQKANIPDDELMKKAQEKFDEIKRNFKNFQNETI